MLTCCPACGYPYFSPVHCEACGMTGRKTDRDVVPYGLRTE